MSTTGWLVAICVAIVLAISGLSYFAGYISGKESSLEEGAYCEAPPPVDCSNYTSAIEEWVEKYEKLEDGWLQIQRDLARCQNYQNIDSMCTDGTCQ